MQSLMAELELELELVLDLEQEQEQEQEQMPHHSPTRRSQHRRAHSESSFRFPDRLDDLLLDDLPVIDWPPPPTLGTPSRDTAADAPARPRHRHTNSMDGYTFFEGDSLSNKAMPADRLAELALVDPKKAKRILANRQSAARSKERKLRYTGELERKVHTLQAEATRLTAQITLLQRDTNGLTAENKELKLKLQALEQQAHLRDALNEALRSEVQRLKAAAGQVPYGNLDNRFMASSQSPSLYFESHNQQQQQPLLSQRHDSRAGALLSKLTN